MALSQISINANVDIGCSISDEVYFSRLTFDAANDLYAIGPPTVAASHERRTGRAFTIFTGKPVIGPGSEELLFASAQDKHPMDWSPDGRFLLYEVLDPKGGNDLWALPLEGDRKPCSSYSDELR